MVEPGRSQVRSNEALLSAGTASMQSAQRRTFFATII